MPDQSGDHHPAHRLRPPGPYRLRGGNKDIAGPTEIRHGVILPNVDLPVDVKGRTADADLTVVRTVQLAAAAVLSAAALAGCGGSSNPPAGHALAAEACQTGGQQAATLASQAAAANPAFATLSADEAALAANEQQQNSELSDGNSSDDSGLGSLAGADALGSTGDIKVISDCTRLGLSVTPK
jgi:hypothetical protein